MNQLSNNAKIIKLIETESTNSFLKNLLKEQNLEEGTAVIAEFQTKGRGQTGNSWHSQKGENLLFSILIFSVGIAPNEQFIISRIASLALKNVLDVITDNIRIKWPNDIYWKDKKIAGVLIENSLQGKRIENSIIGIGLNLNQQVFPEELPNPVSLWQITKTVYDQDYIFDLIRKEFFQLYRDFQKGYKQNIEDEYLADLYRKNGYYWYEDANGKFQAKIENVLPSGHLVLRTLEDNEQRIYAFKEITYVIE